MQRRASWTPLLFAFGTALFVASCQKRNHFRFCVVGDDPNGLLREAAELAAERWRQTTGLDVRIVDAPSDNRIRWVTPDWLERRVGRPDAAAVTSYPDDGGTLISARNDLGFDYTVSNLVHEMAHAMTMGDMEHSATGALAWQGDDQEIIDQSSLDALCKHVECAFQRPETG